MLDRAALGYAPLCLGVSHGGGWGQDLPRGSRVPGFCRLGSGTGASLDPRQARVTAPWGDERRNVAGGSAAQDC